LPDAANAAGHIVKYAQTHNLIGHLRRGNAAEGANHRNYQHAPNSPSHRFSSSGTLKMFHPAYFAKIGQQFC
jgi:hypothetical protein